MNILYFGTITLGMLAVLVYPAMQQSLWQSVGQAFSPTSTLGPLVQAYTEGRLARVHSRSMPAPPLWRLPISSVPLSSCV